ncbi:BMP family lipoprotein [Reinekea blandensis]|nr:BMP family ABC transporter substrate-binding protein [Reinekea blandensis]
MKNMAVFLLTGTVLAGCLPSGDGNDNTSNHTTGRPVLIFYGTEGVADRSFNQMINDIAVPELEGLGYRVIEVEPETTDDLTDVTQEQLSTRANAIALFVGFEYVSVVTAVASANTDDRLILLDHTSAQVDDNIRVVDFNVQEGSFLAGYAAAYKSSGTVGFIGGMNIPLIYRFGCAYAQGVEYFNSQEPASVTVLFETTGNTAAAWNDPDRGAAIAQTHIDGNADVIFAAAGGTGIGVYQQAADQSIMAIGVDSNQNYLQPGTMLTSMVKNLALAAVEETKAAQESTWSGGLVRYGLEDGGVYLAEDEHNAMLYTQTEKTEVESVAQKIVDGDITVFNATSTHCGSNIQVTYTNTALAE